MSTIRDVANQANVSITTVSHVINGTRYVSEELKQRVRETMLALNYQPNGLARSLRVGHSKTIGLIVPDNSNPFFAEISRLVEDMGYREGYSVILCNTDDDPEKEASYINVLINKQVDGIIFISACDTQCNLSYVRDMNIPLVVVDRELPGLNVDMVLNDNYSGGCLAAEYLIKLGHRNMACITGAASVLSSQQRVEGFVQTLNKAGLTLRPEFRCEGKFHYQSGLDCMNHILEVSKTLPKNEQPTAYFVCNDMMAIGAIRAANEHGLSVPGDLSIIGFDNIQISELIFPRLTTIAQPIQEMAKTAIDLLIQKLANPSTRNDTSERINAKPVLIERESCKSIQMS